MVKKCKPGMRKSGNRCVRKNPMQPPQQVTFCGTGFLGLLALLFIALKLIGIEPVASWSWWFVLAPLWIPIVLVIIIVIIFTLMKK